MFGQATCRQGFGRIPGQERLTTPAYFLLHRGRSYTVTLSKEGFKTAYIDLTSGKFEPALYADETLRLQLPKDFQLAQDPPKSRTFKLVPIPSMEIPRPPGLGTVPTP